MRLKKLSIVVPSFNEADNVKRLVSEVNAALEGIEYEIIYVDDSNDNTVEVLAEVTATNPNVRYEHREVSNGLSGAVIRGFELAEGEYIAVMDADLQHPPIVLRDMYCAMRRKADICIPSRLIPGGDDGGLDFVRKTISGTARLIGKVMAPCLHKISDPTGGFFMFRKEILEGAQMTAVGWKILVEVLATCHYENIIEIPYAFAEREAGESKISAKVSMQYVQQLIGLWGRSTKNKTKVVRWSPERVESERQQLDDLIGGGAQ